MHQILLLLLLRLLTNLQFKITVTACNLAVGLELAGKNMDKVKVFDGSWSEWGQENSGGVVIS